jgi:hypothetical protein
MLKQQWTIEEISIFSNSSHLEWRAGVSDTILKGTYPARFGLIMSSNFNFSYMAMSSLTYIYSGLFCEIFLSIDLYRLCKLGIF